MPRHSGPSTNLVVAGQTFTFPPRTIDDFPDAAGLLGDLLARGSISPPIAKSYVQTVARLRRAGRLTDLGQLQHRIERTAANAYVRWKSESWSARVRPVLARLGGRLHNKNTVQWLRVHSLVPPFAGKTIVTRMPAPPDQRTLALVRAHEEAPEPVMLVQYHPVSTWTLHLPDKDVPAHVDPCETCHAIELADIDLETIAVAFENAWGHRDINRVPREAFMFGEPPVSVSEARDKGKGDKIAALAPDNVTSDELSRIGAAVARDLPSFMERLREGADGVYLSRSMLQGSALHEALSAVFASWSS